MEYDKKGYWIAKEKWIKNPRNNVGTAMHKMRKKIHKKRSYDEKLYIQQYRPKYAADIPII